MSRRSEAKRARRNKRRAARDVRWIPDAVLEALEASDVVNVAAGLELFDERITQRGWIFDDEESDDDFAVWFYPPSGTALDGVSPVTTTWLHAAEDGGLMHVMFVGTDEEHLLDPDEFFEHLDAIEAYRLGDPLPVFD